MQDAVVEPVAGRDGAVERSASECPVEAIHLARREAVFADGAVGAIVALFMPGGIEVEDVEDEARATVAVINHPDGKSHVVPLSIFEFGAEH